MEKESAVISPENFKRFSLLENTILKNTLRNEKLTPLTSKFTSSNIDEKTSVTLQLDASNSKLSKPKAKIPNLRKHSSRTPKFVTKQIIIPNEAGTFEFQKQALLQNEELPDIYSPGLAKYLNIK